MNLKKEYFRKLLSGMMIAVMTVAAVSCKNDKDEPDIPEPGGEVTKVKSTILVYAVATNSLARNMVDDKEEMLEGAANIDLSQSNVLLFETSYKVDENGTYVTDENYKRTGSLKLQKLVKSGLGYEWEILKEYDNDISPLNPERMTEVINYVRDYYPAEYNGIIFWSHSSGADPYIYETKSISQASEDILVEDLPETYWFGQDLTTSDKQYSYMNVDVMASAIPDHFYDFIWFDSCYMSNIEAIYQLRNKCDKYIGYATEVWEPGLPYDRVLPYLAQENPKIEDAAKIFFDFYDLEYGHRNATIAVVQTGNLEILADYCGGVFNEGMDVSRDNFEKYSRGSNGPFYDLGDYAKGMAEMQGIDISDEQWQEVLSQFITYKAATPKDFSGSTIVPARYSGISTRVYSFAGTNETEEYYKSLDWYARVFK